MAGLILMVYGRPHSDGSEEPPLMSTINFDDLLGRMFLLPMYENGERESKLAALTMSIPLINACVSYNKTKKANIGK